MLGVTPNQLIDLFDVLHRARHKLASELRNGGRLILSFEKTRGDLIDAVPCDIPLKQHLKRVFSGFASWSHSDLAKHIDHLESGPRGFKAFIPRLAGTVHRLFHSVDCKDTETHRNTCIQGDLLYSVAHDPADVFEMR